MNRLPLRLRVALGYGLTGLALSLSFAAATAFIADDYEEIFVAALLDGQADTYLGQLVRDPAAALPRSPGLAMYPQELAPASYAHLPPGRYELDLPGHDGVHVGVYQRDGRRLVIALDVGQVETMERYLFRLMAVVVLGGTFLSAWLGWWFAGRAIRPVTRLAQAVEALPLLPQHSTLAAGYGQDGIGSLALAIDRYQARLLEATRTEQRFFADASHELRTPIAVIQGAVEVLRDDPGTSSAQDRRLDRIDRSITELALLLEALLLSGRGLPAQDDSLDLASLCRESVKRLAAVYPDAEQRTLLVATAPVSVTAPLRWASCVTDVLLYKLLASAPGAHWRLEFSPKGLSAVRLDAGNPPSQRGDLGLGMAFLERLCSRLGWCLQQGRDAATGEATVSLWVRGD